MQYLDRDWTRNDAYVLCAAFRTMYHGSKVAKVSAAQVVPPLVPFSVDCGARDEKVLAFKTGNNLRVYM